MLVLTRKVGQEILIGDDIRLTVLGIERNRIRLGFTAPRDVSILRDELSLPCDENLRSEPRGVVARPLSRRPLA